MSLVTWHSKAEIRRIVGSLKKVMERARVEISRYEHIYVISAPLRRMRSPKFTGVARRTRRDVIRRDSPSCDVTSGDSPRRRAVIERTLELRGLDDVDVTWHGIDLWLVVGRWRHRKYGKPVASYRSRFYVALDTKYVISEGHPSQSLGVALKTLNPTTSKNKQRKRSHES